MNSYRVRFQSWFSQRRKVLSDLGFQATLTCTEENTLNPSCTIDAESESMVLKMVVWESGNIEIDAIMLPDCTTIIVQRPSVYLEFEQKLDRYLEQVIKV